MNYFNPLIGEIWLVKFQFDSISHEIDASTGQNSKSERPAVVLTVAIEDIQKNRSITKSDDLFNLRFVVPFTGWQKHHLICPWYVEIQNTSTNNLAKRSSANILQSRCCDLSRFNHNRGKLGKLNITDIQEIIDRIKIFIGDGLFQVLV